MNLFSGHRIDPLHIKEDEIYLEDIAHALSLICRGNGHIKYFYSVAQHSLNCAKEAQSRGYSKHVVLSCLFCFYSSNKFSKLGSWSPLSHRDGPLSMAHNISFLLGST